MKKLLVASTALVAFAAVSSAQAADPVKLSLGGYMEQWVGYASNDDNGTANNYTEVLNQADTEIYFTGSTKLDNGLTVGVVIQKEADRGNTGQDDVFMTVKSDALGEVRLGATKGTSYTLSHSAPDVGVGLNDGDLNNWFNNSNGILANTNTQWAAGDGGNHNDGNKVVFYTPNLGGFQAGVSYGLAAAGVNGTEVNTLTDGNDYVVDAALAYNGEFSGVSVGADVSYVDVSRGGAGALNTTASTSGDGYDSNMWRGGLNIGVAGFTFGGSYSKDTNFAGIKDRDAEAWDLGVSYATGPYSVSLTYISSEIDEAAGTTSTNLQDTVDAFELAGSYDLGAGVTFVGSILNADLEDGSNVKTSENNAWGVIGGLKVSF
jgi:outer membrane protein OmpU